ncbi:uncharacterized protein ACNLHF_011191 isoform 1-T2 [Anomaloglossus baeobatrachus]
MERLANQQYKAMEKTTHSQSIRFLRERVQWQPFKLFFRTYKKKNKPTRRSRRRRRLGDDVALAENLKIIIFTFPPSIAHSLLDEDSITHCYTLTLKPADADKPPMPVDINISYVIISAYDKLKGPRVAKLSQYKRTTSNNYLVANTGKDWHLATIIFIFLGGVRNHFYTNKSLTRRERERKKFPL